jgi:hypothetical protein
VIGGYHAILEWICRQPRSATYFNNSIIDDNKILIDNWRYDYKHGKEVNSRRIHNTWANEINTKNSELVVFNFVNEGIIGNSNIHTYLDESQPNYCVVVRDIYNFWASMIHRSLGKRNVMKENWIELVKTVVGNYSIPKEINFIDINFNKWFASIDYRENLIQRLGLKLRDNSIGEISKIGKSSFSERDIEKHKMDVLSRWQFYKNDPDLWSEIDKEVEDLNKRYFGFYINSQTYKVTPC